MLRPLALTPLLAVISFAQVNTGTISGRVTDPSDSVVVNATVTATNIGTGIASKATTSTAGTYLIPALQPGEYRVNVESPGFKSVTRENLILTIAEKLGVDFALELGSVDQKITVNADSPLLETTNATVGQVIDSRKILELPLPTRDPMRLAQIAPGVGGQGAGLGDFRLGGGRVRQNEYYVDGTPSNAVGDFRAVALPSIDALQEFKVETNNLSAEYGHTSGGAINLQTRSGTNEFHGSLYEFAQADTFNANSWNNNRRGSPLGSYTQHQFGGTIGGPVLLPRIYNGRSRTFFFFNYDGFQQYNDGALSFATVPTDLERAGNFSQTTNSAGQKVTIYDPSTYNAATNSRAPFAGNIIPASRFDPVAKYMLSLFPSANQPGDPQTGANNYSGVSADHNYKNNLTFRLDQNFGANQKLYFRAIRNSFHDEPTYWAGPGTPGLRNTYVLEPNFSLSYTWIATPTFIVVGQFGVTPRVSQFAPQFSGFDPTQIPFAANVKPFLDPRYIPNLSFEKISGTSGTFITTNLHERYFFGHLSATKVWSRHTLKFGYEERRPYLNDSEPGSPAGSGVFNGQWTGVNQQAPLTGQGSGFASFLLGIPNSFSFDSGREAYALAWRNEAAFVQDDWRLNGRLTLNLGLRWEYEAPITERYNRLVTYDPSAVNPYIKVNPAYNFQLSTIAGGLLPAGSPAPNLTGPFVGGIGVVNTPQYPDRGNTQSHPLNLGPRFGLAYRIAPNTVFRGGFGILYASYTGNASGSDSYAGSAYFKSRGTANITTDGGQTNLATLGNPFPNNAGLLVGTTDAATTYQRYVGNLNRGFIVNMKPAYEIDYNAGVQHQLKSWLFTGTFVANKGVHLYVGGNPSVNTLNPAYLSLGTLLEKNVPNPFAGAIPENATQMNAATVPYKLLLLPSPWLMGGTSILQQPIGNSHYFAGEFTVERRYSNGLSVLLSDTISKLIEDTASKAGTPYGLPQDGKTFRDIKGVSVQDIPQKFVATYLYDLPVGKGKRWLGDPHGGGAILDRFIGGWKIAGFTIIQSGYPLTIQQSDNFTGGLGYGKQRPTLTGQSYFGAGLGESIGNVGQGQTGRYINPAAFRPTPQYVFGTSPSVLPNFREPRFNQTDFGLMKQFRFTEKKFLEVRIEAQNAFNHPVFTLDNSTMNIQNANFGLFNATANGPRSVQFGARFAF